MNSFFSPLRYPGGKRKLYGFFSQLIKVNNLDKGVYAEPFAGGAGLALKLLFKGDVGHIFINDIDKSLHAFWESVLNHTADLCELINVTPVNMEIWYLQQSIQMNPGEASTLELGFSTFYLNRTNRSGILKGGVIGGKDQAGSY